MLNHVDFRFVTNETKRCFIASYLHNLHFPFCSWVNDWKERVFPMITWRGKPLQRAAAPTLIESERTEHFTFIIMCLVPCYVFGIWRHVTLSYDLDKRLCIVVAVIFSGIVRMSSLLLYIPVCERKHLMLQVYVWQYEYVCDEISVYIDLFCPQMARSVVLNKGASSINMR